MTSAIQTSQTVPWDSIKTRGAHIRSAVIAAITTVALVALAITAFVIVAISLPQLGFLSVTVIAPLVGGILASNLAIGNLMACIKHSSMAARNEKVEDLLVKDVKDAVGRAKSLFDEPNEFHYFNGIPQVQLKPFERLVALEKLKKARNQLISFYVEKDEKVKDIKILKARECAEHAIQALDALEANKAAAADEAVQKKAEFTALRDLIEKEFAEL